MLAVMTPIERVTKRVNQNGDVNEPGVPRPLLTLEEFFDGNDVVGSICCNLPAVTAPRDMHAVLARIRSRPDVADVRVQITMFDDPAWPFSDTVWVITTARAEDVNGWFPSDLAPDSCSEGWSDDVVYEPLAVRAGMRPVACWWD
jgi:hypothetical protein